MPFVDGDDVIEALAPERADHPWDGKTSRRPTDTHDASLLALACWTTR